MKSINIHAFATGNVNFDLRFHSQFQASAYLLFAVTAKHIVLLTQVQGVNFTFSNFTVKPGFYTEDISFGGL